MANVYKTKLDIKNVTPSFKPVFIQYDHARIEIELMDNGSPYDLSNINKVEFTHVRPDKARIIHPAEIVSNGNKKIIRYIYRGSEMDELGLVETSLAVFDVDNKKVSSHSFFVEIKPDLRDGIFEPANPHIGLLQTLIEDVDYLKGNGGGSGGQGPPGRDGVDGKDGKDGRDGQDGEKGDPFTYDDFTPEQLEALRGPTGPQGPPGSDANITAHETSVAPHRYGGRVEIRYNETTNSLDVVWIE